MYSSALSVLKDFHFKLYLDIWFEVLIFTRVIHFDL